MLAGEETIRERREGKSGRGGGVGMRKSMR